MPTFKQAVERSLKVTTVSIFSIKQKYIEIVQLLFSEPENGADVSIVENVDDDDDVLYDLPCPMCSRALSGLATAALLDQNRKIEDCLLLKQSVLFFNI